MTRREFFRECVFKLKKIWYGYCETHKKLCTNKKSFRDSGCPDCETPKEKFNKMFENICESLENERENRINEMKEAFVRAQLELENRKLLQ